MVVNIGDPALGGFAAAAAFAFRGYHANGSWYEKTQWFRAVLIGGAIINTGVEINNVAHGFPWQEEFTRPSQVAHHFLTPIFYAYIAGVFPHLIRMWRENQNRHVASLAFLFILIYAASISYDLSKGGSLAE